MSSLAVGRVFGSSTVSYYGTGVGGDASPIGGKGACGINPSNANYFAAIERPIFTSDVCGLCAQISCSGNQCGGRSTIVEIVDSCTCSSASDAGSIAISLQAMGDLLGGVDVAKNAGVLRNAQWQVVQCPSSFGPGVVVPGTSPISGSGMSSTSISATTTTVTSDTKGTNSAIATTTTTVVTPTSFGVPSSPANTSSSSPNLGPMIGGITAAALGLIVIAFVLWLKGRQNRQAKEESSYHTNSQFVASTRSNSQIPPSMGGGGSGERRVTMDHSHLVSASPDPLLEQSRGVGQQSDGNFLVTPVASFIPAVSYGYQQQQQQQQQTSPVLSPTYGSAQSAIPYGYPAHAPPMYGYPQQQQQQTRLPQISQGDYSREWGQYFQDHPEEYAKYYGRAAGGGAGLGLTR
ncbi:hypothetical protein HDU81_011191 [Chytriomyces hyalinus]|nr:hypothetical protein HDU81_011191 [Chytriomyces hyalinus]